MPTLPKMMAHADDQPTHNRTPVHGNGEVMNLEPAVFHAAIS
jgi:hypothetical protein